jgi:hypothetical protein
MTRDDHPSGAFLWEGNSFIFFVTFVTPGRTVELSLGVAVRTVGLFMILVKHLSGNRVIETAW